MAVQCRLLDLSVGFRHMLSIIVTAHNEGDEVSRTLTSVLSKTCGPLEIVVIDDGSTDGCCTDLQNSSIRVIRNECRMGVAASRHLAVQLSSGTVLVFMDGHLSLIHI